MTYTKQEAYEAIREYFSRPGAVLAKSKYGACHYLSDEGNKCAVGCLIPKKYYDEGFEGEALSGIWEFIERLFPEDSTFTFLDGAQAIHDNNSENAFDFVQRLDAFAQQTGLEVKGEKENN